MKSKDGKPIFQPNKQRDITGKKFEKLTALNFEYRDDRYNHFWKFECECGNKIIARKSAMTSEHTEILGQFLDFTAMDIKQLKECLVSGYLSMDRSKFCK